MAKGMNRNRVLALAFLVALIIAVRVFYYSGPIFANSQDEGIYLTFFASNAHFGNPIGFSDYRSVNFSNTTNVMFNPVQIFQFYGGFEYPILALMYAFGYSATIAILYIMFTSVIEGIFVFLIIDRIAGLRAGLIGTILFAFMPADVLFSTHVQPLVPAVMMLTIALYAFIVGQDRKVKGRKKMLAFAACGFFLGLGYLTNPVSLLLAGFLVLSLVCGMAVSRLKSFRPRTVEIGLIVAGFVIAYSLMGLVYFAEAGNFFLYPMVDHAMLTYVRVTQPYRLFCAPDFLSYQLCARYTSGQPSTYLRMLANMPIFSNPSIVYFGVSFFAFLAALLICFLFLRKDRRCRRVWFFAALFAFYFVVLSFLLINVAFDGQKVTLSLVDQISYLSTLFTLPIVVVLGVVTDALLRKAEKKKIKYAALAACVCLLIVIGANVMVLNHDIGVYRSSMYTAHSFLDFVAGHPNATFYAQYLFSGETNLMSGYRYDIAPLPCGSALPASQRGPAYIAIGGTISMDMDPSIMPSYASCIDANFTNATIVANVPNPYTSSSPLQILRVS